jgi:predicted ArsR family transcriptional regulator
MMDDECQQRILEHLARRPRLGAEELAAELGLAADLVQQALEALVASGRLECVPVDAPTRLYQTAPLTAAQWLERARRSVDQASSWSYEEPEALMAELGRMIEEERRAVVADPNWRAIRNHWDAAFGVWVTPDSRPYVTRMI